MKDQQQHHLTTLSKKSDDLYREGFSEEFSMTNSGLRAQSTNEIFKPEEVKIVKHYRFEGNTDPADMGILYALETNNGLKGTVAEAYGPTADSPFTEFIKDVEEARNRNHPRASEH